MPDDFYENMGDALNGRPLNQTNICNLYGCVPLDPGSEDNIIGVYSENHTNTKLYAWIPSLYYIINLIQDPYFCRITVMSRFVMIVDIVERIQIHM